MLANQRTVSTARDRRIRQIKAKQKEIARGSDLFMKTRKISLRCASVLFGFSEHATAVQRIINDLAHCRSLRIDVHSVARFEVSDDALRSYLESNAVKLRITTRLDVIDSHKPLIQRQVCIKSHDCLYSSV